MDTEHLTALRQAASALINTAGAPTVLAALRALLADPEFAVEAAALPLRPPQSLPEPARTQALGLPAPRPARDKPAVGAKSAATPSDPEWDTLRREVRQAMTTRGLDFADLGQAIGRSGTAVMIDLTSRRAPRPPVQAKLKAWLEQAAPAVAAYAATFPGNGASSVHASTDLSLGTAD
jgi:hypothetical protein